jgi:hypothetical protein
MFFIKKRSYIALGNPEDDEAKVGDFSQLEDKKKTTVEISLAGLLVVIVLLVLSITSVWALLIQNIIHWRAGSPSSVTFSSTCLSPPIRREWRTLSTNAKKDYIDAVQCLTNRPSKVRNNGSLYDDFPFVHQQTAPTGKEIPGTCLDYV